MSTDLVQPPETAPVPVAERAEQIMRLQREMLKYDQVELDTRHLFADGMYCRIVAFRPGTLAIGRVHKREHLFMVVKGRMAVITSSGQEEHTAPAIVVSPPGTKRIVYAFDEVLCLTVQRTDKRDLDDIDAELMEEEPASAFDSGNKLKTPVLEHDQ